MHFFMSRLGTAPRSPLIACTGHALMQSPQAVQIFESIE
jgi:hypothetical protein